MFEVQVANDFASLPRSGPGQVARSPPLPLPESAGCQPDDIVGTGQIGDGRH